MQNNPSNLEDKKMKGLAGFRVVEKECVWMKAGVVNFRVCDCDYDCLNCPFDKAMRSAMDAQHPSKGYTRETGWSEKMRRKYPGAVKPCGYLLTGDIDPPGLCPRNYDCDGCPIELELGYRRLGESIEVARYARDLRGRKIPQEKESVSEREGLPGFQVLDSECVWMKAGVVSFRLCDGDYDCQHCEFDRSMREAMAESRGAPEDSFGESPPTVVRPCIHHLTGRIESPAECGRDYGCYRCPVNESVARRIEIAPASLYKPMVRYAGGYKVAEGCYYHFGHTWIQVVHGECVRIGIDDFAGRLFGTADAIEVPETGISMKQAEVGSSLIRGGNRAPVLSPLSGRLIAVNRKVLEHPALLCDDPYHEGWLFQLEPYLLKQEAQGLYYGEDCLDWMDHEHRRLLHLLGPGHEGLAATGGETVSDVIGHFPELGWDRLVLNFLRTSPLSNAIQK